MYLFPWKKLKYLQIKISPYSSLVGKDLISSRIKEISGAIILAVKKLSDDMIFNPSPQYVFEPGDILIALGERKGLARLEELAAAKIN